MVSVEHAPASNSLSVNSGAARPFQIPDFLVSKGITKRFVIPFFFG